MSEVKINMSPVDKKKERFGLTTAEAEAVSASASASAIAIAWNLYF